MKTAKTFENYSGLSRGLSWKFSPRESEQAAWREDQGIEIKMLLELY